MPGETKQMVANVRAEFHRTLLNKVHANSDVADICNAILAFDEFLNSIDVPVEEQVPALDFGASEDAPVADKFGG